MFLYSNIHLLIFITTCGHILAVNNTLNSTAIILNALKISFVHQKLYSFDSFSKCVSVCKSDICETVYKNENHIQHCVYQYCENGVCDTFEKNVCYMAMNRQLSWFNSTTDECVRVCGCKLPKHKMRTKRQTDNHEDDDDDEDEREDDDSHKNKKEIEILVKKLSINHTEFSIDVSQYSWCTDKQTNLEDCQKDCVRDCDGPAKNGRFGRCYTKCRKQLICANLGHACIKKCKDACNAKSSLKRCKNGKIKMSSSECLGKAVTMKFLYADWDYMHKDETLVKRFCTSQCVIK